MIDSEPRHSIPAPRICIIAGEVSGDQHASALVRALREERPDLECFGTGGQCMRAQGVETLYDIRDLAVMGFSEVLRRYGFFRKVFHHLCAELDQRKPDVVILVDYPGFNLRFAEQAHRRGIKVIYYISPQVWAWKKSRIPKMARVIDHLMTIFPFEAKHFADSGLQVTFVGHPLIDELGDPDAMPSHEAALPWADSPGIALLPGSRVHEVERILPTMLDACRSLLAARPGTPFIIASASDELSTQIEAQLLDYADIAAHISIVTGRTRAVLRDAKAAWVASGTATLETALLRCPMVICYRVGALTYALAKRVVKLDHVGMVNIIAERGLCPEYIQDDATAKSLSDAILPLLEDTQERRDMLEGYQHVIATLGDSGAADRAAKVVLDEINGPA